MAERSGLHAERLLIEPPHRRSIESMNQRGMSRVHAHPKAASLIAGRERVAEHERQPETLKVRQRDQPRHPSNVGSFGVRSRQDARERHGSIVDEQCVAAGRLRQARGQIVIRSEKGPDAVLDPPDVGFDGRPSLKRPPSENASSGFEDPIRLKPLDHVIVARHGDKAPLVLPNELLDCMRPELSDLSIDDRRELIDDDRIGMLKHRASD